MKKILVFLFLCLFVFVGFAQARDNRRDYRKYDNRRDYRSYHRRDVNWEHVGAAGAILGGAIILDRILPPRQVIVRQHYYSPPPAPVYPQYRQTPTAYPTQPYYEPPRYYSQRNLTPAEKRDQEWQQALDIFYDCLQEREVDLRYTEDPNNAKECDSLNPRTFNWRK